MKPFREKTVGPARRAAAGFSRGLAGRPSEEEGAPSGALRNLRSPGLPAVHFSLLAGRVRVVPGLKAGWEGGLAASADECYSPAGTMARVPPEVTLAPVARSARLAPRGHAIARVVVGAVGSWRGVLRGWGFRGLAWRSPDRPVLKHGPRSPSGAQVVGLTKPEGEAKA